MEVTDYAIVKNLFAYTDLIRQDLPKILDKRNKAAVRRALNHANIIWNLSLELKAMLKEQKDLIYNEKKILVNNTIDSIKKVL